MSSTEASRYRAEIGAWVANHLRRQPGVHQIPCETLDIFLMRDFLSAEQCRALIALIDKDRIPSQLLAPTIDPEFRTSESCNLDPFEPASIATEARYNQVIGIPSSQGEWIQGQRYAVGQQFKPHHDFFFTDQPYWPEMERTGGQRTWTGMVFLNAPEAGGETVFPDAGLKVRPRTGTLLAWNNMDKEGEPNPHALHQAMPVEAGTKYVITKWYRERAWSGSDAPTYVSGA